MRTIEVNLYTFEELSDEAKEKALDKLRHINIDYDWWEGVYMHAENVGIKIKHFDTGRPWSIGIELQDSACEVARKIIAEHGKACGTYKTAEKFLADWAELVKQYSDGINTEIVAEDNEYEFDNEADELEKEFRRDIGHEYLTILQKEEEYLSSDEAVKETILANEYEFNEEGEM